MNPKLNKLKESLKNLKKPCALIEMDAFNYNVEYFCRELSNKKIRVATKSIRSLGVLKYLKEKIGKNFNGYMSFSPEETLWLLDNGLKNILIAYPCVNKSILEKFSGRDDLNEVTFMVDSIDHLKILDQSILGKINICIDIDMSLKVPGLNFGVYRSSVKNKEQFALIFKEVDKSEKFIFKGAMGYEAQVAGVTDKSENFLKDFVVKLLKKKSISRINKLRGEIADFLSANFKGEFFYNAGGTGSIFSSREEEHITEVTVGSGFYCSTLFDKYENLLIKPALFYALEVTRNPEQGVYTLYGGGYIASGSIGVEKCPSPVNSKYKLISTEMCGEVQTPIKTDEKLSLGEIIFFRGAKAGELLENFNEVYFNKEFEKTYRGEGKKF